jgi:hypothetical protein
VAWLELSQASRVPLAASGADEAVLTGIVPIPSWAVSEGDVEIALVPGWDALRSRSVGMCKPVEKLLRWVSLGGALANTLGRQALEIGKMPPGESNQCSPPERR